MKEKLYFIEEIIPEKIRSILQSAKFEKEIIDYSKSLLKDSIKTHCKPIYINNKKLIIAVDNPIWANELMNYKQHFLSLINKRFNNYLIDLNPKFLPKYFIEKKKDQKLSQEEKTFIEEQLKMVEDIRLKDSLYNLIETFIIVDKK